MGENQEQRPEAERKGKSLLEIANEEVEGLEEAMEISAEEGATAGGDRPATASARAKTPVVVPSTETRALAKQVEKEMTVRGRSAMAMTTEAGALERFIDKVDLRMKAQRALQLTVVRNLRPGDILLFGNDKQGWTPYFRGFAGEHIRGAVGMSIKSVRMSEPIWQRDAKGQYYYFVCYGTASHELLGDLEVVGIASSRDKIWSERSKWDKEKNAYVKYLLPPEDITLKHVALSAYTGMMRAGVVRSIGFRGLGIAELGALGIDTAKLPKVSFKKGSQSDARKDRKQGTNRPATTGRPPARPSGTGAQRKPAGGTQRFTS